MNYIRLAEILLLIATPVAGIVAAWLVRRRILRDSLTKNKSALMSYHVNKAILPSNSDASFPMFSLREGRLDDGSYYNILNVHNSIIYHVQLEFQTDLHVLAIATATDLGDGIKLNIGNSNIKKVDLEGDFPNYFHLYVTAHHEKQIRYILDPATMANVIDFCCRNSWELINDELYIATELNTGQMVELQSIQDFITKIKPALAKRSTAAQTPHRISTQHAHVRLKAECPICKASLVAKSDWHECPNGHGHLLTGAKLSELRKRQLTVPRATALSEPPKHEIINCPACHKEMTPITYGGGNTIVDSCTNCQYRWLDSGEIHQIAK